MVSVVNPHDQQSTMPSAASASSGRTTLLNKPKSSNVTPTRAITVALAVSRCASPISSPSSTARPVMPTCTGSKQRLFRV